MSKMNPGQKLRKAIEENKPLRIPGTINAYSALLAEQAGHSAIYLSGAGVANASYGLPDLAVTHLEDVLIDVRRITDATELPLLVDIDTGWGGAFNIARTIKSMIKQGAAGVHIEDQAAQKRCGHRPNKVLVDTQEMVDRIKAAVDARNVADFLIMARTDALANEGMEATIERVHAYIEAGADALFPEAVLTLDQYQEFSKSVPVPVLANITEFGATPLFSCDDLAASGVSMVLYPLSAFRAMAKTSSEVYEHLALKPNQQPLLDSMQTREQLYKTIGYHAYEQKLDRLFHSTKKQGVKK